MAIIAAGVVLGVLVSGQAGGATPPTKTPQAPDTPEVTCEAKNPAPTQTVELPEDARAIEGRSET
jgi:hypothetical protein